MMNFRALWLENTLTDWLILLAAIVLGLLAGRVAAAVLRRLGDRLQTRGWRGQALVLHALASPASLALLTLGLTVGFAELSIGATMRAFWLKTLVLLYTVSALWYIYNLLEVVDFAVGRLGRRCDSTLERDLAPLLRKTLRIFLVIIGLLFLSESVFNQDIGAWLAGLGIAGLAVSLAAQDSLKNLFGSITILLDQPFRIGERIVTTGHDGVVEEIGFRSTKLRTQTGSLVNIPNGNLVNNTVENISRRRYIRRSMNLAIPHDTPPSKVEQALQILRGILADAELRAPLHTHSDAEYAPRALFSDISPDHLILNITYWYAPPNYWDYLEHAEKINRRICAEFAQAGIAFAGPQPA